MRGVGFWFLFLLLAVACDLSDLTAGDLDSDSDTGLGGSAGASATGGDMGLGSGGGDPAGGAPGDFCKGQDFCAEFEDDDPALSILFDEVRVKANSTVEQSQGKLSVGFSGVLAEGDCSYADVKKLFATPHSGFQLRVSVWRDVDADGFLLTTGHGGSDDAGWCLDLLAMDDAVVTFQTNGTMTTKDTLPLDAPVGKWFDLELKSEAMVAGGTRHTVTIDGASAVIERLDCDVGASLDFSLGFFCSSLVSGSAQFDDLAIDFIP